MLEHRLFPLADARAFTPTDGDRLGTYGTLAERSVGDWSWRPYRYDGAGSYLFAITGPRCTCTLAQPVGTSCPRHNF